VIGNCQAGWALMMLAAKRPELCGPIIVAGSPLSYWAGVRGVNPMRYTGGLLGGSWLTSMMSDLGKGNFDGAWLVQNFENLNPANTLWSKQYNLYAKIDTRHPAIWASSAGGAARDPDRRGDAVYRRQPLRRQQAQQRRDGDRRRRAAGPAKDPLAHRLSSVLQGGQHHPAAAGPRLDSRPLRKR
jgi:hypothetical protein